MGASHPSRPAAGLQQQQGSVCPWHEWRQCPGEVWECSLCSPRGHQLKHQGDLGELWGGSVTPAAAHPSARDGWRFSACATKTYSVRTPLDFRWSQLALPAKINSQLVPLRFRAAAGRWRGHIAAYVSSSCVCWRGGAPCPAALGFVSWAPWPFFCSRVLKIDFFSL